MNNDVLKPVDCVIALSKIICDLFDFNRLTQCMGHIIILHLLNELSVIITDLYFYFKVKSIF